MDEGVRRSTCKRRRWSLVHHTEAQEMVTFGTMRLAEVDGWGCPRAR